ncbi:MAG: hypothetical protein ACK2UO_16050 [Caldilineaceae bacterium]
MSFKDKCRQVWVLVANDKGVRDGVIALVSAAAAIVVRVLTKADAPASPPPPSR